MEVLRVDHAKQNNPIWDVVLDGHCAYMYISATVPRHELEWLRGVLVLVSQLNCFKGLHKLGAWFFYFKIDFFGHVWYRKNWGSSEKSGKRMYVECIQTNKYDKHDVAFLREHKNIFFIVIHLDTQIRGPSHNWDALFAFSTRIIQKNANVFNLTNVLKFSKNEKLSPKLNSNDAQRHPNGAPKATNGAQGRPRGAPMDPRRWQQMEPQ